MGVLGLFLIFRGGLGLGAGSAVGLLALFLAVVSQSLGLVWLKRIDDDSPPLAMTLGILVVALPLFFAAWWLVDGHVPEAVPERAVAATLYLGTFGSVLGFALYYYLIKNMEAGRIALITLITPVIAVWLGTASIVLGLGLHRWGEQWVKLVAR
jgi:drug/metabolite transporter (DMT)-like permease